LVFDRPYKTSDSAYTILARSNQLDFPRIGIIVSKKNVPKAAQRIRLKRIARESFRMNKSLLGSLDIVVIYKRASALQLNSQLFKKLEEHWQKLHTNYVQ
jgi:ribonuclease P protein component